jgi:L,D-transpeptidase ErfK/SrfK
MAGFTRRSFVAASGALLATQGLAETDNVNSETTTEQESDVTGVVRHNISSFRALDWRPYFDTLKNGAILVDISFSSITFLVTG